MADYALDGGLAPDRLRLYGATNSPIETARWSHPVEALDQAGPLDDGDWLVLHLAVIGRDSVTGGDPARVRAINDGLMRRAMALAEGGGALRVAFFSSGAVGRLSEPGLSDDLHAYARLKAEQEESFADWASASGRRLVIPRVFNVGGPFVTFPRRYALSDMILSLREAGHIEIRADRPVIRSFIHVRDLARVVFQRLLEDDDGPSRFDVGGGEAIEVGELARAVVETLGRPETQILRPPMGQGPADRYVGDGAAFVATLNRSGAELTPLRRIIEDAADYLAANPIPYSPSPVA